MSKVFGEQSPGDILEPGLQEMASGRDEQVAMEWNFRNDWRVSRNREREFKKHVAVPTAADGVQKGLNLYFNSRVRYREFKVGRSPDFEDDTLNADNKNVQIHPGSMLIHILDVGGLNAVFASAIQEKAKDGTFLELSEKFGMALRSSFEFVRRLDELLPNQTPSEQSEAARWAGIFIEAFATQIGKPYHPVWATTLPTFARALGSRPTFSDRLNTEEYKSIVGGAEARKWTQWTGVPKVSATWLMALCYPAGAAKPLYRPSMLDANWFPEHFPAPVKAGLQGHPMHLNPPPAPRILIPEYIHPQFRFQADHIVALKRLDAPVECDLPVARAAHQDLLRDEYRPTVWVRDME
jgi:hypothetical protein